MARQPWIPELLHLRRLRRSSGQSSLPGHDLEGQVLTGALSSEVLDHGEEACGDGDVALSAQSS